jgi:thymidylate synthase (FAD)
MRLVKPSYQILAASNHYELPYNYDNPNNLIEIAGRTCYKSEDKITKDSSEKFVQMLKNNGHNAMIEHSWELRFYSTLDLPKYKFLNFMQIDFIGTVVAGNVRAFDEWNWEYKDKFSGVSSLMLDQISKEKRWDMYSVTVKFICDRGVTHELVRHRPPGFAQESTRWCNYSQERFGNHLSFIIPVWLNEYITEGEYSNLDLETINTEAYHWFKSMIDSELDYNNLVTRCWIPGRARSVLPNSLKTEIVVTADLAEWQHIFKLRTAPNAHEQMREIMIPLQEDFKKLYPEMFI